MCMFLFGSSLLVHVCVCMYMYVCVCVYVVCVCVCVCTYLHDCVHLCIQHAALLHVQLYYS